jgi:hypothetical protein
VNLDTSGGQLHRVRAALDDDVGGAVTEQVRVPVMPPSSSSMENQPLDLLYAATSQ